MFNFFSTAAAASNVVLLVLASPCEAECEWEGLMAVGSYNECSLVCLATLALPSDEQETEDEEQEDDKGDDDDAAAEEDAKEEEEEEE